ncbi:hypothetical protein SprV_0501769400 [Sparganum proliferum]
MAPESSRARRGPPNEEEEEEVEVEEEEEEEEEEDEDASKPLPPPPATRVELSCFFEFARALVQGSVSLLATAVW